jgi:hypothetical protein
MVNVQAQRWPSPAIHVVVRREVPFHQPVVFDLLLPQNEPIDDADGCAGMWVVVVLVVVALLAGTFHWRLSAVVPCQNLGI